MNTPIRLVANDKYEVHPPMRKPSPIKPVEFDVPVEATRGGELTLTFSGAAGHGQRRPRQPDRRSVADEEVMDDGRPWESPDQAAAARVAAGLRVHDHDAQPRHRGAGGDRRASISSGWSWSTRR